MSATDKPKVSKYLQECSQEDWLRVTRVFVMDRSTIYYEENTEDRVVRCCVVAGKVLARATFYRGRAPVFEIDTKERDALLG